MIRHTAWRNETFKCVYLLESNTRQKIIMFVDVLLSYIQVVKKRLMKALKYKGRD